VKTQVIKRGKRIDIIELYYQLYIGLVQGIKQPDKALKYEYCFSKEGHGFYIL
jgi:hypothetical protein